jgi:outer membrane immunogenic protein
MSPKFLALVVGALNVACGSARADWSRPYLGLFAGYTEANDAWDVGSGPVPAISPEGLVYGGFVGAGYDVGGLVLGGEFDLSFPDVSDEGDCGAVECTLDVQVLSSLRGRAGLAFGPLQVYGTAGLAVGFLQAESALGFNDSKSLAGWTAGAGLEWQTGQGLRLGVEYRHSDYGDSDIRFGGVGQGDINLETDDVRLRIAIPLD